MIEKFQKLGLSYYEAKALHCLLKQALNIRQLSKEAEIPLGKVYSIVKSLEQKRLIKQTASRPKLAYVENASFVMQKLISQKQKEDEQLIADMQDIATELDTIKSKPSRFFQIGTTVEENKEIQLRTFIEAQKEVLQIINTHHKPKSNRESKTLWEKEIVKAVNRGVIFKAIYPRGIDLPQMLEKITKGFHVRRFDTTFTRCDVIDGRKVLIKLTHEDPLNFGGIIFIENERLAKNITKIFNEMWEHGE